MTASNLSMAPESVQIFLATSLPAYKPGETVTALLTASTSQPHDIEFQDMEISFTGIERIDTSWISPLYRKNIPAINTDKRRIQRHVVKASLQAATQGDFTDLSTSRRFLIRLTLPQWLPPTYKGIAVRYWYYLEAKIHYSDRREPPTSTSSKKVEQPTASSSFPASFHAITRLPLLIWPSRDTVTKLPSSLSAVLSFNGSKADRFDGMLDNTNNQNRNANASIGTANTKTGTIDGYDNDVFPSSLPEEFIMKCWEVGAGTTLEDAVGHITKLTTSIPAMHAVPCSPGGYRTDVSSPFVALAASTAVATNATATRAASSGENDKNDNDIDDGSMSSTSQSTRQNSMDGLVNRSVSSPFAKQLTLDSEISSSSTPRHSALQEQPSEGIPVSNLKTFALRIGNAPLVKVSLHPTFSVTGGIYPGSIISTTLEFPTQSSPSSLQCMQMTATLETEETVDPGWRPRGSTQSFTSGVSAGVLRKIHDEHVELTRDVSCTNIVLSLPSDATPTFSTGLIGLKWILKFVFVAAQQSSGSETLVWTLPLTVSSM